MLGQSCLVCDEHVKIPVDYVENFPICSDECVNEWNTLTRSEQQAYLEGAHALSADMGG